MPPNPINLRMADGSTSHVARMKLNMRIGVRLITRLTSAFSQKLDAHINAISLYFCWYNFCRIQKSLRVPPAMAAGVANRLWSMEGTVALIDASAEPPKKRGPYEPRPQ